MNNTKLFSLLIMSVAIGSVVKAQEPVIDGRQVIQEQWSTSAVFTQPESAAFDSLRNQIFVSNVNGYAKDGNGFISRVSGKTQEVELEWLGGLDSPTGLTVGGNHLYAVDYDQLRVIDIDSKKIISSYAAPVEKSGLNDVVVSSRYGVFVTGSSSSSIYHLENDKLVVWKQDVDGLKHANGLFISDNTLIFGGVHWKAFDLDTKEELKIELTSKPEIEEIDGISDDGCGGFIVTLLNDKRLWRVSVKGDAEPLSPRPLDGIDLYRHGDTLFVPRVGGKLSVFSLNFQDCQRQM